MTPQLGLPKTRRTMESNTRICQSCLNWITNTSERRHLVVTEGDLRIIHAYTEPDGDTVLTLCGERYAAQSPSLSVAR